MKLKEGKPREKRNMKTVLEARIGSTDTKVSTSGRTGGKKRRVERYGELTIFTGRTYMTQGKNIKKRKHSLLQALKLVPPPPTPQGWIRSHSIWEGSNVQNKGGDRAIRGPKRCPKQEATPRQRSPKITNSSRRKERTKP